MIEPVIELDVWFRSSDIWLEFESRKTEQEGAMADSSKQDEVDSPTEYGPGHRGELLQKDFEKVLILHKGYVNVGGDTPEGKKADLCGYDLRRLHIPFPGQLDAASLVSCDLRGQRLVAPNFGAAFLINADLAEIRIRPQRTERYDLRGEAGANVEKPNFSQASLVRTNLDGADIQQADFHEADFAGATLYNATLKDCDFTGAVNLIPSQLAGADLSGAKLPDHVDWFPTLTWIENLSRDMRKLSASLMVACVFAWLMLLQLTDAHLVLDNSTLTMPIINTGVKVVGFFIGMSVLLLVLFAYLLVNLQRNWEMIATLPAFFQDGKPLYRRVFPWMPNGVIARYLPLQKGQLPPFHLLQTLASYIMLYAFVPVTMFAMWVRFFPRHDWPVTLFLSAILIAAVCLSGLFTAVARRTLQGRRRKPFVWMRCLKDVRLYVAVLCIGVMTTAMVGTAKLCINSDPYSDVIGSMLATIGWSPAADLRGAVLSTRPEPWMNTAGQRQQVIGVQLARRDLRWADAESAFLLKANLFRADMFCADLYEADLRYADLSGADLTGAVLIQALLDSANFMGTILDDAFLPDTDLRGAKNLTAEQVRSAITDSTTLLPDYLEPAPEDSASGG